MSRRRIFSVFAIVAASGTVLAAPAIGALRGRGVAIGTGNLSAVTCPTNAQCVATGSDTTSVNGKTVRINTATAATSTWSGSLATHTLDGVACAVTIECVGVGNGVTARILTGSGASSIVGHITPPAGVLDPLNAVACPNSTECFAVGFYGKYGHTQGYVVRTTAAGAIVNSITIPTATGIGSVACPTSTTCLLAAADGSSPENIQLLVAGKPGAKHALPPKTYIQKLACYKAVVCYALAGSGSKTNLVYKVNPATGALVSLHAIGGGFSGDSMACPSASQCLITGFVTTTNSLVTLANGVPSGPHKVSGTSLSAVACTSNGTCFGVGMLGSSGFVERI